MGEKKGKRVDSKAKVPLSVVALGVVSFLNDVSSEMVYPLLPLFLSQIGASVAFIGVVEGVAETTVSLLKLFSGWIADRFGKYRVLTGVGYGLSALTRPLLALSSAPWHVLVLRVTDRFGKGVRTAPRDSIIAHVSDPNRRGLSFGIHRALDNLGAAVGPLFASLILALSRPDDYRLVFWFSFLPAALSLIILWMTLSRLSDPNEGGARVSFALPKGPFRWLLLSVFVFTLGNSSDAFLLLRAEQVGLHPAFIPLLWSLLNVLRSLLSAPGGALADRIGHVRSLRLGWWVYALAYLGFAFASSSWQVVPIFVLYAFYFGLTEGTERALVANLVPADQRGKAFGLYHFAVGVGMLPASLIFGLIWQIFGPTASFALGASLAFLASFLILLARPSRV